MEETHTNEIWDKHLKKWDEFLVEKIVPRGTTTDIYLYNGNILYHVPVDNFEEIKESIIPFL